MQPYATRPRAVLPKEGEITITIKNPIADRIRKVHAIAQIGDPKGDRTSLEKYCVEIIENFITDKRKESQL